MDIYIFRGMKASFCNSKNLSPSIICMFYKQINQPQNGKVRGELTRFPTRFRFQNSTLKQSAGGATRCQRHT